VQLRSLVVDGTKLAFREWEGPDDAPVVLLHSLGEDSTTWTRVAAELSQSHVVYAFDLRGHGASEHTPQYSLELMRDDIQGAIDYLGLSNAALIGHSLGGMVAYLVAVQDCHRLTHLVLEEAPPPLPVVPAREIPEPPADALSFDWNAVAAIYAQRNEPDPCWWGLLRSIKIPTLIIGGGSSSHVDQRQIARMADQLEACQVVTIDVGHNVHGARPDEFVALLTEFLRV
jgi:pimeloyl-ACP methyl ester carboxylesterase